MIRIRRIEPGENAHLQRRMEEAVESLLRGIGRTGDAHEWLPRADVLENASGIILTLELAGVRREEIEILIEGPFLRVAGVRQEPSGGCLRWHQMEIGYGAFERVFSLPADADLDAITAASRDGFLTITIPRRPGSSRQVPVDAS